MLCPLCTLETRQVGRYVQGVDDLRQAFAFPICERCRKRLDRLPVPLQIRQQEIAARRIAQHPKRYPVKVFGSEIEASIYRTLSAENPE